MALLVARVRIEIANIMQFWEFPRGSLIRGHLLLQVTLSQNTPVRPVEEDGQGTGPEQGTAAHHSEEFSINDICLLSKLLFSKLVLYLLFILSAGSSQHPTFCISPHLQNAKQRLRGVQTSSKTVSVGVKKPKLWG